MAVSMRKIRTRSLGVLFLAVLVGLLSLSIAVYNKAFTKTVGVTLYAGATGNELILPAEVKLRGIVVGNATDVSVAERNGQEVAKIHLALYPKEAREIPTNVDAEIIPETLFGDKYISLVLPGTNQNVNDDTDQLRFGDKGVANIITQSQNSLEVEAVFNNLVPLLNTLQPVALNLTLSNLAQALQGRGNELGQNLANTDTYLSGLNPDLGNIQTDLGGLEELATNYNEATPDLLAQARQFSVNARTLVAKGDVFAAFLNGTKGFADTLDTILTVNQNNFVELASTGTPILGLLATYSPEYACLLEGLAAQETPLEQSFDPRPGTGEHTELHLYLSLLNTQPPGYTYPTDKPDLTLKDFAIAYTGGPTTPGGKPCYGLPTAPHTPVKGALPINKNTPGTDYEGGGEPTGNDASSADDAARVVIAPTLGVDEANVPDLDALLVAPQIAGMKVTVG